MLGAHLSIRMRSITGNKVFKKIFDESTQFSIGIFVTAFALLAACGLLLLTYIAIGTMWLLITGLSFAAFISSYYLLIGPKFYKMYKYGVCVVSPCFFLNLYLFLIAG